VISRLAPVVMRVVKTVNQRTPTARSSRRSSVSTYVRLWISGERKRLMRRM
jgi:hypothetical protein